MSDTGSQKSFSGSPSASSRVNDLISKAVTHHGISATQLAKVVAAQSASVTSQDVLQVASRLQQQYQQQQQQPVMAKKSNAVSPSVKDSSTPSSSGMVQFNLVNENGIVTPIEINATVAAAAAMVAAQKQQNQKIEAAAHNSSTSTSSNSVITSSFEPHIKAIDGRVNLPKVNSSGCNNGLSVEVNYIFIYFIFILQKLR